MTELTNAGELRAFRLGDINNKKKLFERLAELLSSASAIPFEKILDSLTSRERMGSTCIGSGVAIPHCKLPIEAPIGVMVVLDEAIDCTNKDEQITVIFAMLIPEDQCQEHLTLLREIASTCLQAHWLEGLQSMREDVQLQNYLASSGLNTEPFSYEVDHS